MTTADDGGYGMSDLPPETRLPRRDDSPIATLEHDWRNAMHALAMTEDEWAELNAKYGPGGQADAHRRAYRGVIATRIRQDAREATPPRKMTESECEDAACADDGYMALLTSMEEGMVRYGVVSSQRARAKETLEWCRARSWLLAAEMKLMPGGAGA